MTTSLARQQREGVLLRERISTAAIARMKEMTAEHHPAGAGVRIGCAGGDREGLAWSMSYEYSAGLTDICLEFDGLTVFVDGVSARFLRRHRLGYEDAGDGAGFTFDEESGARDETAVAG